MKRFMLMFTLLLSTLVCFADDNMNSSTIPVEIHENSEAVDDKKELKLNVIKFYNIDRIKVINNKKERVFVMDWQGELITSSDEDIDMNVPAGDYIVYTESKIKGEYVTNY